jgi:RNA polymerase sigma-70 factor (ECF subfamily)
MTAARRIADFSGTDDDFAGWLFVIARNLCANANRRSQRRATTPTDVDPRHLVRHRAEDDADAVAAADWIQRTLAHLSPRERDVVAAIDIAGLDIDTTSRLLSISRAAVRAAHHRAMRRLAEVVDVQATAQPPTIALRTRGARDVSRAALTD